MHVPKKHLKQMKFTIDKLFTNYHGFKTFAKGLRRKRIKKEKKKNHQENYMKPHKGSLYKGNIILEAFQIINPRKFSKEIMRVQLLVRPKLQNMGEILYFEKT